MRFDIGVRQLALAAVLTFLFGVVGLVTIDEEAGTTQLTAAAAATSAKGTARMAMTISFTTDSGGQTSAMTGEGVIDIGAKRGSMTFTSPLLPGPIEVLTDGTTSYLKATLPQFQPLSSGKPWIAVDVSHVTPRLGGDMFGGAGDPLQSLRLLQERGAASDVRENGTQDVRDVPTRRFAARLNLKKLLEALPEAQRKAVSEVVGKTDSELEIWVDAEDVVRRTVVRSKIGEFATTMTMELFDFGVPVQVAPPPEDQVHRLDPNLLG